MKAKILWVEGKRADSPSFIPSLRKKDYQVETVPTGTAALARVEDVGPDVVVVNAASLRTSGKRICRSIRDQVNGVPIILIVGEDQTISGDPCANVVLTLPFTARKLVNRINPYIPSKTGRLLQAGPISLDLENKRVRCLNKEATLTPRLTQILQILITRQGEVIERETLFREVWKTEYTADTRTLDVHISWLRQALEEDPRKPRFLKTIRKVGYRLDV
jgi:DNA-binding response OmpR family regulator